MKLQTPRAMKNMLIITIILALTTLSSYSQSYKTNTVKYRITAVKNGDATVISQSNIAEVETPMALYIPNAFTPDGDGLNDTFGPVGDGIQDYKMTIYNRWGELVFETNNINDQWNGTYQGEEVQEGTYVYNISIMKGNQNTRSFKEGAVTLVK